MSPTALIYALVNSGKMTIDEAKEFVNSTFPNRKLVGRVVHKIGMHNCVIKWTTGKEELAYLFERIDH